MLVEDSVNISLGKEAIRRVVGAIGVHYTSLL
jgi:hypothetical protein